MARFVSSKNPIAPHALKRRANGTVIARHYGREDVRFTRMMGGWRRERTDVTSEAPKIVSSGDVARECNTAVGCKSSWARVY